jgi:hypothetical protein
MIVSDAELDARIDRYLVDRIDQFAGWYDKKAVKLKASFLRARVCTAIGAVLIPVLSTLRFPLAAFGTTVDLPRLAVSLVGVMVALLIALEGVLHHREQWKNYRTTEQYIRAQRHLFENRVGDYADGTLDEAFKKLVWNIESAIKNENEVTLNVLSRNEVAEVSKSHNATTPRT